MMKAPIFFKKIEVKGWQFWILCYAYAILSEHHPNKSFGLKIKLVMPQVTWTFNIFHLYGPKFEKKKLLKIFPPGGYDLRRPQNTIFSSFEAFVNHSPLVGKFSKDFFFKFWSFLMKNIESPGHLKHYKVIFKPKLLFGRCSLNMAYA